MSETKLIITKPAPEECGDNPTIRISGKAYALLTDLQQRTGRTRHWLASKMIEFAFDFVEIEEE